MSFAHALTSAFTARSLGLALSAVALTGCLDHPLKEVQYDSVSVDTSVLPVDFRRKIDILFVIDNSGSMGEEQAALAANFSVFVDLLEAESVDADYRIGVTTTDDGNPWCSGTGPEAGALQLRSCRDHLDDFVFASGTAEEIDRRVEACEQRCPEQLAGLTTEPTTTDEDAQARPRPWLQRELGVSNVPSGVTTAQALACWGPQGINGCAYESPLEAMRKALVRSGRADEDGAGFLRDDALLQVVFITDEADCSLGPAGFEAFDPDGSRALWSDPTAAQPSSALCWNAGVACHTQDDGRTHCEPADLDAQGQPTSGDDAVLHPLSRYLEILEQIDQHKRARSGRDTPQVLVSVLAGVPEQYAGEPVDYGPGDDPEFRADFGVGAGCSSGNGEAVPPVRLLALANAMTDEPGSNLFSICNEDYSPVLEVIAQRLVDRLRPSCVEACVAQVDTLIDGVLPSCTVVQEHEGQSRAVPHCVMQADGTFARPEGEPLCVHAVTGDELAAACRAEGNVEFRFLRGPGASYGDVTATCERAPNPRVDCPELP